MFTRALAAALCLCWALPANGQEVTPEARALFAQVERAYRDLRSLHVKSVCRTEYLVGGRIQSTRRDTAELRVERPNRVYVRERQVQNGRIKFDRMVVCDGAYVWSWSRETNRYTRRPAPRAFSGMLTRELEEMECGELRMFIEARPSNLDVDLDTRIRLSVAPPATFEGADVDVLLESVVGDFTGLDKWRRYLIDPKTHLIQGMVDTIKGKDARTGKPQEIRADTRYPLLETSPTFAAADFAFTPPPGAKPAAPSPKRK